MRRRDRQTARPRRFAWCSTSRTGDPAGSSGGSAARSTGPSSRRRSPSGSTGARAAPSGSSRNPSWPGRGACASATAPSPWPSAAASSATSRRICCLPPRPGRPSYSSSRRAETSPTVWTRAILANPSDHRVVPLINRMIKNRDFWMPFAPSVLREREADYLVNPKGLASPYMMLEFPTNPKRRDEIIAAIHPHDGTARAHIVDEAWNPPYYRVLREFEARTGIGAVLNTSFNLHGEPLVCSPEDAVDTFERSGLPHLALGRYLISKRTP